MGEQTVGRWLINQKSPSHAAMITPIGDSMDHTERFCICKPKWRMENTGTGVATIITHNSLDGREGTWEEVG